MKIKILDTIEVSAHWAVKEILDGEEIDYKATLTKDDIIDVDEIVRGEKIKRGRSLRITVSHPFHLIHLIDVPSYSIEELSGLEEYICPYDFYWDPKNFVTDEDFKRIFSSLPKGYRPPIPLFVDLYGEYPTDEKGNVLLTYPLRYRRKQGEEGGGGISSDPQK